MSRVRRRATFASQTEGEPALFGIEYFKLLPRDSDEVNRSSTSLELMFDLATVVAVASAAHGLAQDIEADQIAFGTVRFMCSFFMAWLAWANYTWFASGYDNKSVMFRMITMTIMFGSLTLAAGIRSGLGEEPHWLILIGFSIMRLGMILLWLGAANGDRKTRPMALRYASGTAALQVYWNTIIVTVPPTEAIYYALFALGAAGELLLPAFAERRIVSNWHHGHIIDRHNAFNIIVLGECFAAIALIISNATKPDLWHFWQAGLASIVAFSMWGLYFDRNKRLGDRNLFHVLSWAYGHCVLFAAGAATGAGLVGLLASSLKEAPPESYVTLGFCIPVALYVVTLWWVSDEVSADRVRHLHLLVAAPLILASSAMQTNALECTALLLAITLAIHRWQAKTASEGQADK